MRAVLLIARQEFADAHDHIYFRCTILQGEGGFGYFHLEQGL